VKRRVLLELQWQGTGGRFRHIVLSPPGLLRTLGACGVVAVFALAVVGALFVVSSRALEQYGVDAVMRENTELKARQDALRERAFDLAEQLYWHFERERRMARLADTAGHAWVAECPRPPARDAGNDAILAWLSEQGTRLEALGNELTPGRVETGAKLASAPATVNESWTTVRAEAALYEGGMEPAGRQEAAPSTR